MSTYKPRKLNALNPYQKNKTRGSAITVQTRKYCELLKTGALT